jgi:hypothetical protein
MKIVTAGCGLVVVLLVGACGVSRPVGGGSGPSRTAESSTTAPALSPSGTPTPTESPAKPHFDTPEAAMTYLAVAWNDNDLVSLGHVTNPAARSELNAMHSEATNLRLTNCVRRPQGDYQCFFAHDYPAALHKTGTGQAIFLVGPALTPGWYMTVFESCG